MKITVTIECASAAEAMSVLGGLSDAPQKFIKHEDRPDVGFPPAAPAAAPAAPAVPVATGLAAVGFGQGVTLPPGAIPAPSTAAVAASPTAPVATPSGIAASVPPAPAVHIAPAALVPGGAAAAVPTAPVIGAVTLDKQGLPWDGRIHASTKAFIKDGTWRQKRDLDPTIKATVEAELRAAQLANAAAGGAPFAQAAGAAQVPAAHAPATAAAPIASPSNAPFVIPVPPAAAASGVPSSASTAPTQAPSTQQTPVGTAETATWDFAKLMETLTPRMEIMGGTISHETIAACLGKYGLTSIGQLASAPNVVPLIAQELLA